jgi:hypothetical protein
MSIFKQNEDQKIDVLLCSSIKYVDAIAYLSLHFLNLGALVLKSTDLLSVSESSIYFCIEKRNEIIQIDEKCEKQIHELQTLFKDAIAYEST